MIIKMIEIRDVHTCIPAMAVRMVAANDVEWSFLRACGYPLDGRGVVLMKLSTQEANSDPYGWPNRTMRNAHLNIIERFDALVNGQVVDVRVILGERDVPVYPEIGIVR